MRRNQRRSNLFPRELVRWLVASVGVGCLAAAAMPTPLRGATDRPISADTEIDFKLVKAEAGPWEPPPRAVLASHQADWDFVDGDAYEGVNARETYWTLKASRDGAPLPELQVSVGDAPVERVIVGDSDVEFTQEEDQLQFQLVDDRGRVQLIQTKLPGNEKTLPIHLIHNAPFRRAGPYADRPFPSRADAAVHNFLFAAREGLRLMGDLGPKDDRAFDGYLVLMGYETAFSRGHADFPPHFHIMLYVPGYRPGSQVPHFYFDDRARLVRNRFDVLDGPSRVFEAGEPCKMRDLKGQVGLSLTITAQGGLAMRKAESDPPCLLKPDPQGADRAVEVWMGKTLRCRVTHVDDVAEGKMRARIERYDPSSPEIRRTLHIVTDRHRYDPFTGRLLKREVLVHPPQTEPMEAELIDEIELEQGAAATQGLAAEPASYYSSANRDGAGVIFRFDPKWKLIEKKSLHVPGVNHIGAIDYHQGRIWGGWLTGGENRKRRSMVTEIDAETLEILRTFEITDDVTWIDPICFDGTHVWVGDLSDLGFHRYRIEDDRLVRDAVFRYPRPMHFSQGIRIRGGMLYSIHTFGDMDGLFEFDLEQFRPGKVNFPRRVWPVAENRMHLEGFDFVPGRPSEIFHAQGSQVDRWRLKGIKGVSDVSTNQK